MNIPMNDLERWKIPGEPPWFLCVLDHPNGRAIVAQDHNVVTCAEATTT